MIRNAGPRIVVLTAAAVIGTTCDSPSGPGVVAYVQVSPKTWTFMAIGDTTRFTAVARDANGVRIRRDLSFTWGRHPWRRRRRS